MKVKEYYERLLKGVQELVESKQMQEFMAFQARFHNYSFANMLMIFSYKPDATLVAGMKAWNKHGRKVKKGERGIPIFAPIIKTIKKEVELEDGTTEITEQKRLVGFRVVYVWDVSQTEGDPVPENIKVGKTKASSTVDCITIFNKILSITPIPVRYEDLPEHLKGYYEPDKRIITLNEKLNNTDQVKTLIHELAHHLSFELKISYESDIDKPKEETIAEGAAYIVCAHFGIDSSEYSFPYIAKWTRNPKVVLRWGEAVQKVSSEILNLLKDVKENVETKTELKKAA